MKKEPWKVAVIGCGCFANAQYFPFISKEANAICVAAVDIIYERAVKACERYGIPNSYHNVTELIENCDFDIAIDAASIQAHMLERTDIKAVKDEGLPGFTVPVEYSICPDGFTASILSDAIIENSKNYRLQSVDFLEYFAAYDSSVQGNFVVPDGSGALIALNSDSGEFNAPYYGEDYSVRVESQEALEKQMSLPVFGIDAGNCGVLGIIESGSEIAELTATPHSNSSTFNHAWTTFNYLSIRIWQGSYKESFWQ